jgi:hypothetical protein
LKTRKTEQLRAEERKNRLACRVAGVQLDSVVFTETDCNLEDAQNRAAERKSAQKQASLPGRLVSGQTGVLAEPIVNFKTRKIEL